MAEKVCPRTAVGSWECTRRAHIDAEPVLDGQTVAQPTKAFSNGRPRCTLFKCATGGTLRKRGMQ
jgi:hypothetical protein